MSTRNFGLAGAAAVIAGVFVLAMPTAAIGADGADLFRSHACGSCHGEEGRQPILSTYPKLAGQNRRYLINQMMDFRSGARSNGTAAVMRGAVSRLSDEEIIALADYLNRL